MSEDAKEILDDLLAELHDGWWDDPRVMQVVRRYRYRLEVAVRP